MNEWIFRRGLGLRQVPATVWTAVGVACLASILWLAMSSSKGSLVLPGLGTGLVALWLMLQPHWGVLAVLAAWFVEIDPVPVKFISFAQTIVVVLLIPLGFAIIRDRGFWVWRVAEVRLLLAIGAVLLLASAWSHIMFPPPPSGMVTQSAELWRFATRFGFLILFLYFIRTPRHIYLVVLLLTLLVIIATVDGLTVFAREGSRLRSLLVPGTGNPNRMALAAMFAVGLVWFFRLYAPPSALRSLTLPPLLVLPVATLLTGSRSGFIQLVLFTLLALREHRGLTAARKMQAVALILVVIVVIAVGVPTATYLRATTFQATSHAVGGESLKNRITALQAAVQIAMEHPLLGVGPGNFGWRHQVLYGDDDRAHNSYLWALTSGGPMLLILYLLLFRRIYRRLRDVELSGDPRLWWLGKALRINLLLFLLATIFADYWQSIYPYVFIGLGVAMTRLSPSMSVARTAAAPSRQPALHMVAAVHSRLASAANRTAQ